MKATLCSASEKECKKMHKIRKPSAAAVEDSLMQET